MTAYLLDSSIQNYAWGSRSMIADLLGRAASGAPEAELWLGAHARGPSRLVAPAPAENLLTLIDQNPSLQLGASSLLRFGSRLPFLFKVLAAEQPLSLQAHPDRAGARAGFEREQSQGVPLEAEHRNYKDDNHKPELICALTRFYALSGFRAVPEALEITSAFGLAAADSPLFPAWRSLRASPDASGVRRFFEQLYQLPEAALIEAIQLAANQAERMSARRRHELSELPTWLGRFASRYPADPGVILSLLLNLIVLEPGQALYLPAGNLHAYLGGLGLEIMASSDNVLRGGMTPKHVDVQELSRVVDFEPSRPPLLEGVLSVREGVTERRYPTPAPEFELTVLEFEPGARQSGRGPALLLILSGAFELESAGARHSLARGAQVFCNAQHEFGLFGEGRVALARLNPLG